MDDCDVGSSECERLCHPFRIAGSRKPMLIEGSVEKFEGVSIEVFFSSSLIMARIQWEDWLTSSSVSM